MNSINSKIICLIEGLVGFVLVINVANALPESFIRQVVLDSPQTLSINFLPDGRMLTAQKDGIILLSDPSQPLPLNANVYLTLDDIDSSSERGLYDLAIDPDFGTNGYIYLLYNRLQDGRLQIVRFEHLVNSGGLSSTADPDSWAMIWVDPLAAISCCHQGGGLEFAQDGKLYFTLGDKSDSTLSQDLSNSAGKLFRINTDGSFPSDNPDFTLLHPNPVPGIWAFGLRNPFRMSYDDLTDRLLIGEVGGNTQTTAREDVHLGAPGANYGWPYCEGSDCNPAAPPYPSPFDAFDAPVFSYAHSGTNASLTGGVVYRGNVFPSIYEGAYFYGDYARGIIRYVTFDQNGMATGDYDFDSVADAPVAFAQGPDDALYYADIISGEVRRYAYIDGNQPPVIQSITGNPLESVNPDTVNFSAIVSDPENDTLSFRWEFGDGNESQSLVASNPYTSNGRYFAYLHVSDGVTTVTSDALEISIGHKPSITILSPANNHLFLANEELTFSALATDQDGVLTDSDYDWEIIFWHEDHEHPVTSYDGVTTGTFAVPGNGHDFEGNTRFEFRLTVTDSDGLVSTESIYVYPDKINMQLETNPSGLNVYLDGIPKKTPYAIDTLIDFQHSISVEPVVCAGFQEYVFTGWSDTGSITHDITVPGSDIVYTANYMYTGNTCQITSCGIPDYNPGTEQAVFLWRDCVTDEWSMKATSGGSPSLIQFQGDIISSLPITDVIQISFENGDVLNHQIPEELFYNLRMINTGNDGFNFTIAQNSQTCFDRSRPSGAPIYIGKHRFKMQVPFDLETLQSCSANPAQLPQLSVSSITVMESDDSAVLNISLSSASDHNVVVNYSTVEQSASDGQEYSGVSGVLVFQPGELLKSLEIDLLDDSEQESPEVFTVVLNSPINARPGNASGTVTIVDDDGGTGILCGVPSYNPGSETAVYIYQDCQTERWHLRVTGGGQTQAVTYRGVLSSDMPILNIQGFSLESSDILSYQNNEIDYTFKLYRTGQDGMEFLLSQNAQTCFASELPVNVPVYVGQDKQQITGDFIIETLLPCDNTVPQIPVISSADINVSEVAQTVAVTVNLSNASSNQVSVSYATVNGTAFENEDFLPVSGELIFNSGETQKTINIPLINDDLEELSEIFSLFLSNPVNSTIANTNIAITITDDDSVSRVSCGEPTINFSNNPGVYLWEDCFTGTWHVRVLSGGSQSVIKYNGNVSSSAGYTDWQRVNLESSDNFSVNNNQIDFSLKVIGSGYDGFSFVYPAGSQSCFDISSPASVNLFLGGNKVITNLPLDLVSLGICNTSPPPPPPPAGDIECGQPGYGSGVDKNLYLWKDCAGDGAWHLRTTAGGSSSVVKYSGIVDATQNYVSVTPFSIEGSDVFTVQQGIINYTLKLIGAGQDGFDFKLPNGSNACMKVNLPTGASLRLGVNEIPVTPPFDLTNKQFCQ